MPVRIKIVAVGDGGSGKTSILSTFVNNFFPEDYLPTVFETYIKPMYYENEIYDMVLFDTAGQEDYDRLRPLSYIDAQVVIICFPINEPCSLSNVTKKWISEVNSHAPNAKKIIVATKFDLVDKEKCKVDYDLYNDVMKKCKADGFVICSAKTKYNLEDIFLLAIKLHILSKKKIKLCNIL